MSYDDQLKEAIRELLDTRLQMVRDGFDPGDLPRIAQERLQEMQDPELGKLFYTCEAARNRLREWKAREQKKTYERPKRYKLHDTMQQLIDQARKHNVNIFYEGTTYTPAQFKYFAEHHHPQHWTGLEASWKRPNELSKKALIHIEHLRNKERADQAPYPGTKQQQTKEQDDAVEDKGYHPESVEYHADRNLTEYLEHLWSFSSKCNGKES